ncbi:MAG: NAD-dependent epimerase/dehydratase family protein [Bacillota bacterium]|nr:NAD-dependent epimerase/dehydratase family protein [Bacillota bacterium]
MADDPVLITGAAGFIGEHLALHLARLGRSVVAVDRRPPAGSYRGLPGVHAVTCDVAGPRFRSHFRALRPRAVIHLAAQSSLGALERDPSRGLRDNVLGTLNVIEACTAAGTQRMIFASSAAVYGSAAVPMRETAPPRPQSAYGWTKAAGEQMVVRCGVERGLEYAVLRFANCYGPGQEEKDDPGVMSLWLDAARTGAPLRIAAGRRTRDFVHVSDVVEAIALALDARLTGETLNISTGVETSLHDLAVLVCRITGATMSVQEHAPPAGDILRSALDRAAAGAVLGWKPRVTLAEGLLAMWRHVSAEPTAVRAAADPRAARSLERVRMPGTGGAVSRG